MSRMPQRAYPALPAPRPTRIRPYGYRFRSPLPLPQVQPPLFSLVHAFQTPSIPAPSSPTSKARTAHSGTPNRAPFSPLVIHPLGSKTRFGDSWFGPVPPPSTIYRHTTSTALSSRPVSPVVGFYDSLWFRWLQLVFVRRLCPEQVTHEVVPAPAGHIKRRAPIAVMLVGQQQ